MNSFSCLVVGPASSSEVVFTFSASMTEMGARVSGELDVPLPENTELHW